MVGVPLPIQLYLVYTKGNTNKVADALSCYYMSDRSSEQQEAHIYANVDARLDPDGDYITENHKNKLKLGFPTVEANTVRRSARNQTKSVIQPETSVEEPIVHWTIICNDLPYDPTALDSIRPAIELGTWIEKSSDLMSYIPIGYKHDLLFITVLNNPTNYAN